MSKHRTRTHARPTPRNGQARHAPHVNGNGRAKATPARLPNGSNGAGGRPRTEGRAANGTYVQGCKPGPGNPYAKRCAALKAQLLTVAETRLPKVIGALFDKAESGDTAAIEIVLKHTLGRPSPAIDVDRVNSGLDELRLLLAAPLDAELMLAGANGVSVSAGLAFLQGVAAAKAKRPLAFLDDAADDDGEDGEGGKLPVVHRLRERVLASRAAKG
jgi:hypothetical protein